MTIIHLEILAADATCNTYSNFYSHTLAHPMWRFCKWWHSDKWAARPIMASSETWLSAISNICNDAACEAALPNAMMSSVVNLFDWKYRNKGTRRTNNQRNKKKWAKNLLCRKATWTRADPAKPSTRSGIPPLRWFHDKCSCFRCGLTLSMAPCQIMRKNVSRDWQKQ